MSYFIDATDWENPILMRQVSAHPPTAVAEHIMDLQFTFDIFDDEAEVAVADLGDAGGLPNQIRKMNIHVSSRSPKKTIFHGQKQYVSLRTSVSGRNLAFRDRYE